jgi:AcrR family transcriptional regulator
MPKVVDREKRRAEVAEAAWRVVERVGIRAATLRDIAEEMGITKGSLAHYFQSKQQLVAFAFEHGVTRVFARMEAMTRVASPGVDRLRIALELMTPAHFDLDAASAAALTFWAYATDDKLLADVHLRNYATWRTRVSGFLEEAKARGQLRAATDVALETTALMALVDGTLVGSVLEPDQFTKARILEILDHALSRL